MTSESSTPDINSKRFYGKYRGTVESNADPSHLGRVTIKVPDVLGDTISTWAVPCVPVAGLHAGFFLVPPAGSWVWVEFEQGDPDYPIWVGGFWKNTEDVPDAATSPAPPSNGQNIVLQTTNQNALIVSDAPATATSGGIVLESAGGARIVVNDSGIYIDNGKGASIVMNKGPKVAINVEGLTVD
jgi:uncharacterized protein involved in type VI secretion and phage assembly